MSRSLSVILAISAFSTIACQTDLGIEQRAFSCTDKNDCLSGFECVPLGGASELSQCVRAGNHADASDILDVPGDSPDANVDVSQDVPPSDVTPDTADAADAAQDAPDTNACNSGCPDHQTCIDGVCVASECTNNTECGFEARCESNICVPIVYKNIEIEDVTSLDEEDCEETSSSPGADIFGVRLLASDGAHLTMGRAVDDAITPHPGNQHTDPSVIDSATRTTCQTDGESTKFVSLGCNGGTLRVVFPDASDGTYDLLDEMQVEIGEFGPACSVLASSHDNAEYQVSKCTSDGTHCVVIGTDLSGISVVTL